MRPQGTLALILCLALPGCGFTQSWGDFTVGGDEDADVDEDAGRRRDAGPDGVDAGPGMDAAGVDAAGTDAGATCAENAPTSAIGDGVFTGDTVAASQRLTPTCRGGTAPDLQYQWTAPRDGFFRFTTEGSMYDTVLSVLLSCDGMEIACNDDAPVGEGSWSSVSVELMAGQTVFINVDGFNGGTGAFVVNILEGGCGDGEVQVQHEACDDGGRATMDGCSDECTPERVEGALRIVEGPDTSEGRLEIFHMGMWGTVCDDPASGGVWDAMMENANVACRQLGFSSGVALAASATPDGSEPTWLDQVECAGTEARLDECLCGSVLSCALTQSACTSRWGCENCDHDEDVGVDCAP